MHKRDGMFDLTYFDNQKPNLTCPILTYPDVTLHQSMCGFRFSFPLHRNQFDDIKTNSGWVIPDSESGTNNSSTA